MLGHALRETFSGPFETYATIRSTVGRGEPLVPSERLFQGVDAREIDSVARVVEATEPDVVVNCIGVIKQREAGKDAVASIAVNALFPHQLAALCSVAGTRLIHLSTDCVFSGRRGHYGEADVPDAEDLYGRSKLLGEPTGPSCLTIRTSYIGPELATRYGLLEWFLGQRDGVRGFRRAVFSGLTTYAFADLMVPIIRDRPDLVGLWHVASDPINKFDLLTLIKSAYESPASIEADDLYVCDRSLDGSRFRKATGYAVPDWPSMIAEMRGRTGGPTPQLERTW
jgi:dTDP-4-dehydrorhamnose reductase